MRVRTLAPAIVGLTLLVGLTACSGGQSGGSSAGASGAGGSGSSSVASGPSSDVGPRSSSSTDGQQARQTALKTLPRSRIYQGELTISARDVATVADEATALAGRTGAEVDSDDRTGGDDPSADITVRMAPSAYFGMLDKLATLPGAHEDNRRSSVTDVSLQVADLQSRVATQQTTIRQIRQLIGRTTNLQAIVQLQQTLGQQEVQLESLQAQQRELRDRVALATIVLHVQHQATMAAKPRRHNGFSTGLIAGWHGLTSTVRVLLTVLGAVLPFVVVLAVLGVPALLWWRRRQRLSTS